MCLLNYQLLYVYDILGLKGVTNEDRIVKNAIFVLLNTFGLLDLLNLYAESNQLLLKL